MTSKKKKLKKPKKNPSETFLVKRNSLTLVSTILVAEIVINNHFLSFHQNLMTLSLFFNKKKLKMREMNFGTKTEFLKTKGINHL
jgi:hypothetical protein